MNIYFLHANHFKVDNFKELLKHLKVAEVFQADNNILDDLEELCKGVKYTSLVPKDRSFNQKILDSCVFRVTNRMKNRGQMDLYEHSTSNAIANLNNPQADNDPNILIIIPEYEHRIGRMRGTIYGFSPLPKYTAQYMLNILRNYKDDRYADRIGFLWIDSYLWGKGVTAIGRQIFERRASTLVDINPFLYEKTFGIAPNEPSDLTKLRDYYLNPEDKSSFSKLVSQLRREWMSSEQDDIDEENEARWRAEQDDALYDEKQWQKDLRAELDDICENGGDWIMD